MTSLMYDQNTLLIVAMLLVALVLGIEFGYRFGRPMQPRFTDLARSQINAIQASMLGILALLLGFTFSQSLERFNARSEAVVDEANAIGTAYLRAQLIPPAVREAARALLRDYVDLRVREAGLRLTDPAEQSLLAKAQQTQNELWEYAKQTAGEEKTPVSSLFIQSINELIDSFGRREAEIKRHVPEIVILLLFVTFVLTGVLVGGASGVEGHRPTVSCYLLVLLIVLLVFVIIDLDRPRRGFIEVPQDSLIQLRDSFDFILDCWDVTQTFAEPHLQSTNPPYHFLALHRASYRIDGLEHARSVILLRRSSGVAVSKIRSHWAVNPVIL